MIKKSAIILLFCIILLTTYVYADQIFLNGTVEVALTKEDGTAIQSGATVKPGEKIVATLKSKCTNNDILNNGIGGIMAKVICSNITNPIFTKVADEDSVDFSNNTLTVELFDKISYNSQKNIATMNFTISENAVDGETKIEFRDAKIFNEDNENNISISPISLKIQGTTTPATGEDNGNIDEDESKTPTSTSTPKSTSTSTPTESKTPTDTTTAKSSIAKAGLVKYGTISVVVIAIIAAIAYVQYKKYKEI